MRAPAAAAAASHTRRPARPPAPVLKSFEREAEVGGRVHGYTLAVEGDANNVTIELVREWGRGALGRRGARQRRPHKTPAPA